MGSINLILNRGLSLGYLTNTSVEWINSLLQVALWPSSLFSLKILMEMIVHWLSNYWQKIVPETTTFMTSSNLSKTCQRKAYHWDNFYDYFLTSIGLFWVVIDKSVFSGTVNNLLLRLSLKISEITTTVAVAKLHWLHSKLVTRVLRKEIFWKNDKKLSTQFMTINSICMFLKFINFYSDSILMDGRL